MCNLQLAGIYTVTHTDTHRETHSANTAHAASVAWVHTTNAMHSQGRSFVWIVRQQQSVFMKPLLLDWCSLHIETLTKRVHVAELPRSVCRYRIQKSASQIGTESNRRGSHSQRSSHLIRENSLTLKKVLHARCRCSTTIGARFVALKLIHTFMMWQMLKLIYLITHFGIFKIVFSCFN